ncbi:hypothetical protein ACJX0J_016980, partial [Zea mays]
CLCLLFIFNLFCIIKIIFLYQIIISLIASILVFAYSNLVTAEAAREREGGGGGGGGGEEDTNEHQNGEFKGRIRSERRRGFIVPGEGADEQDGEQYVCMYQYVWVHFVLAHIQGIFRNIGAFVEALMDKDRKDGGAIEGVSFSLMDVDADARWLHFTLEINLDNIIL